MLLSLAKELRILPDELNRLLIIVVVRSPLQRAMYLLYCLPSWVAQPARLLPWLTPGRLAYGLCACTKVRCLVCSVAQQLRLNCRCCPWR